MPGCSALGSKDQEQKNILAKHCCMASYKTVRQSTAGEGNVATYAFVHPMVPVTSNIQVH